MWGFFVVKIFCCAIIRIECITSIHLGFRTNKRVYVMTKNSNTVIGWSVWNMSNNTRNYSLIILKLQPSVLVFLFKNKQRGLVHDFF